MHPKARFVFIALIGIFIGSGLPLAFAAAPPFRWVQSTEAYILAVATDSGGNCYIALNKGGDGATITFGGTTVAANSAVAKIAGNGELRWLIPLTVAPTGDGSLVVWDAERGFLWATSDSGSQILKISPDGEIFQRINHNYGSIGKISVGTDGHLYLTGFRGAQPFIASYASPGGHRWMRAYETDAGWYDIGSIGGAVYVTGDSAGPGLGYMRLTKLASDGSEIFTHSSTGRGRGEAILATPFGIWFGGASYEEGTIGGRQMRAGGIIGRFSENGVSEARDVNDDRVLDLALNSSGMILTAEIVFQAGPNRCRISCFTQTGFLNWSQDFGGSWGYYHGLAVTGSDEIFTVGSFQQTATFGSITLQAPIGAPGSFLAKISGLPEITLQPQGGVAHEGESFTISVGASGPGTLTYQWFKDGVMVSNQAFPPFNLFSVQPEDSGLYWVGVRNSFGVVESSRVQISVIGHTLVSVATLAGSGVQGHLDSTDPLAVRFYAPDGGGVTRDGVIFVGDAGNHLVRYILPSGEVGTWAGSPGSSGYVEALGGSARFNAPLGLFVNSVGDLLVGDYGNHRVRKVLGLGYRASSLIAGDGTVGYLNAAGPIARLNGPNDLVEAPNGEIYFTEFLNHTVCKIGLNGEVTLVAGGAAQAGYADATGASARFNGPAGLTFLNGQLYVTDWNNHRVRKINLTTGAVTTHAGSGEAGLQRGYNTTARFFEPNGIVADSTGNLYVTEHGNHAIRRIATDGWVSTLAGNGTRGFADGDRDTARFNEPGGISIHPDSSLVIADTGNHRIRRIVLNNTTNEWTRTQGFLTLELNPTVKIHGAPGERFRIESADALSPNNWMAIESVTLTESPQLWRDPRPDGGRQRHYRAVRE